MKSYLLSVVITAVLISLSELILPQEKLKSVVGTIFTIVLLLTIISPFKELDLGEAIEVFNPTYGESLSLDQNTENLITDKLENYYEKKFKDELFEENLVTERVKVELEGIEIVKIQIYLSNLVIPENNGHININVIKKYVAEILNVDEGIIEIYD